MDATLFQDVNLVREKIAFAFVVGALVFLAWEAFAKRRGAGQGRDYAEQTGYAGPAMAGALAGTSILVAGLHLTGQLWG